MAADAESMFWFDRDALRCAAGGDDEPDYPDDDDFDKQYTPLNDECTNYKEDDPEDDVFVDQDVDEEAGI